MKTYILPPALSNHPKTYRVLGDEWIRRRVDTALSEIGRKQKHVLHPSGFGRVHHPVISEIYNTKIADGSQDIRSKTPVLDYLELDLKELSKVPPPNLHQRLRDDHDFHKVSYELRIAAGFHRLGHFLYWFPAAHQQHPEFLILSSMTNVFSVECKKRDASDGYEQEASVFWKHLQYDLSHKMEDLLLNYWIKVSGREFCLPDVKLLVSEIMSQIPTNNCGEFDSLNQRYHIEYLKIAEPDQSIPMELVNMFPRGAFGLNAGEQPRDQIMKGPLRNPKLLRLEVIDDPEHRIKGILRNLKVAAKQVVKGLPSLVYLDINIDNYEQEKTEFDHIADVIRKELNVRYRNVSVVVLTNIYPCLSMNEHLLWRVSSELIVNPKQNLHLPKGLCFPGDEAGTHWLAGTWLKPLVS
ncbi:MAG: hypothetical protein MUO89_05365 [Dehalococcoidia bacterium]|nr:hypothetical protein [Dehalococcoidia bacterium]